MVKLNDKIEFEFYSTKYEDSKEESITMSCKIVGEEDTLIDRIHFYEDGFYDKWERSDVIDTIIKDYIKELGIKKYNVEEFTFIGDEDGIRVIEVLEMEKGE